MSGKPAGGGIGTFLGSALFYELMPSCAGGKTVGCAAVLTCVSVAVDYFVGESRWRFVTVFLCPFYRLHVYPFLADGYLRRHRFVGSLAEMTVRPLPSRNALPHGEIRAQSHTSPEICSHLECLRRPLTGARQRPWIQCIKRRSFFSAAFSSERGALFEVCA
jgi:hypothetical protein